jgi:ATP-binding cassette subfamily B protein
MSNPDPPRAISTGGGTVYREAFVRARRFLQYNAQAALLSQVCAVVSALVLLAILANLGCLIDLLVEQGDIAARVVPNQEKTGDAPESWLASLIGEDDAARVWANRHNQGLGLIPLAYRNRNMWYAGLLSTPIKLLSSLWTNYSALATLVLSMLFLAVLHGLLTLGMQSQAAKAVIEASGRLRRAVYHQTYRLGTLAFRALGSSEAIGLFTRHLETVQEGLHGWLTTRLREPSRFIALLLFALILEGLPWLTVGFILFAVLVGYVAAELAAYVRTQERQNTRRLADQLAFLQESLQMMPLAKCYSMELFNQARVERQLAKHGQLLLHRYRDQVLYQQTLILLGVLALTVLATVAGWSILSGNLDLAGTITLTVALAGLAWPVWLGFNYQRLLQRARQSATQVFAFLDRPADVGQSARADFLNPCRQSLEFTYVSLKEPGTGLLLLNQVSLHIPAGQRIAIVGDDDVQKHALVYLIPRFLDPTEGEIRVDGKDVRWVTLESLRLQVALVLQRNLVFNDTVFNNIGCGDSSYTLPQILEAAKVAHAHQFIQNLPDGYETHIGELGHHLSVGEQFRIGLARAILRDPAIVIIEEPTTPVDDDTKTLVDDTYTRFLADRTVIFLPHRLSTIRSCNCVFLLHEGKIVAAGPHRDLLNQNDLYRHLQYLEFNVFTEHG